MNKKERFEAVRKKQAPDHMPVWPRVMSQMIFGKGVLLPEVTGEDCYDSDRITELVLQNIEGIGYDLAIPTYIDYAFGVPPLGGKIMVPDKFGIAAGTTEQQSVMTKDDWPEVQRKLARFNHRTTDPRMKGALEVIKNVSREIGDHTPLVSAYYVGTTAAMFLFRPNEAFMEDFYEDPDWVDEMCKVATDWAMDWVRAQYDAGSNSVTVIAETMGTLMMNPSMGERFNLPNIARLVEMVNKEFNQGVWLHIHGDMKKPASYRYLERLAKETGIEGLHLDENHTSEWVKENVVDKLGIGACIITDGAKLVNGTIDEIDNEVKDQISGIGDGLGMMMAPSCQVLPATPDKNFKAWVDATHKYGTYPLQGK
ncbi:uroporphyrinogen decarboxylase family protein [Phosphitispora fastidiosa]|uniref:uroporphyrinogen decarboxylase family protein n=1 Tax=Phosphitispora fastidiosa TaxID=2837202 RepID=UPI001E28D316|nr:uroporphyrinogen decarboxylase family protein [Phosphitispora fastidiosa]MBU7006542.1 uroporphyrinogen-III decarboxylase [Phosphitispora fastidiosa]